MNDIMIIGISIIPLFILLTLLITIKLRKSRNINIRNASLSIEELESHARRMAIDHAVSSKNNRLDWPIKRMNDNYDYILSLFKDLNSDISQKRIVPPAAEWLLDNFYIIEEQVKGMRLDLSKKQYNQLPVLKKGPFKGNARIYAIATEFVSIIDGQVEENTLIRYLEAYQSHSILFDREIRLIPAMIRLALIENIRSISEKIQETQSQWNKADEILEIWLSEDTADTDKIKHLFKSYITKEESSSSFIEHLFYRLRRSGRSYSNVLQYMDQHLDKYDTTTEKVAQKEHNAQAVSTVSIGNCVMSLKYVSSIDWDCFLETVSFVEAILKKDPSGIYDQMDTNSRNYYLRKTEELAKLYNVSELHIAREAIELAKKALTEEENMLEKTNRYLKRIHVGYYLIDKGIKELEYQQKGKADAYSKIKEWFAKKAEQFYLGSIAIMTALFLILAILYVSQNANENKVLYVLLACVVLLIPASELAISIINRLVGRIVKPTIFTRIEYKAGIPEAQRTMVVVPALLSNEKRVDELLKNLENHYLANAETNVFFALIGSYKDSDGPNTSADQHILERAASGIAALNKQYAESEEARFYFYHRISQLNENDNNWIGWERKRGALMEFNEMLLGSNVTSFRYYSENLRPKGKIKYIITLDADTQLPLGMAKKMIGTMAHPLNLPIVCPKKGIVIEGHGLMQPRISFDIESSNKSNFSKIFTGQEGIDPYASAISDVYQDLFGEGIFTGKGIYDVDVFHQVLKDAVPENAVLSHDLLEGSYVRAALVSNLELVDSYPTKYNSYITRLERWIRGDWQLIPWLKKKIYNKNNRLVANPLSHISTWKIFDNLRRSLVAPSIMVLIFMSFSLLPGSALPWLGFGMCVLSFPLVYQVIFQMTKGGPRPNKIKRHIIGFFGLRATVYQFLLTCIFLPYQAVISIKAIVVTLARVLITKKNMLEWVTSADSDKAQKNTLSSYMSKMGISSFLGLLLVLLSYVYKPEELDMSFIIALVWFLSPFMAYYLSKDQDEVQEQLGTEDLNELRHIARKTWRYFEEFANEKNHYLAPDNYQQEPNRGIACRTSPTNIGLGLMATMTARDLGYIGTIEMFEKINQTITTIESLEMWQGHLYNWYDTITLIPLQPRYVSTVDSGNYVGYLMTLAEGLRAYNAQPIIDASFIHGMRDTINCGVKAEERSLIGFEYFNDLLNEEHISPLAFYDALRLFQDSLDYDMIRHKVWRQKLKNMIKTFEEELIFMMPYLSMMNRLPKTIQSHELMACLEENVSFKGLIKNNNKLILEIDRILNLPQEFESDIREIERDWLKEFRIGVIESTENVTGLLSQYEGIIQRVELLSSNTRFAVLYSEKRHLFSIGYNIEDNLLSNSFYDLLASESRQTSYIAIARGEVPPNHWAMLGRSMTVLNRYQGLISWSGTMFEYLMPLLIMKHYKNTLLDETYSFVIKSQKKYGAERNMPWGVSESAFNALDSHLDYQYKAIGVPWLGLKRGLIEDAVTAPYATFLALMVSPAEAFLNIKHLKEEGLEGHYGYYEAADYTPERLGFSEKKVIIKSYMAHHQGMSLMAINNYLNHNIMQKRFSANPYVKAADLLLQEKVPVNVIFTKENKEKITPFISPASKDKGAYRRFTAPDKVLPKAHILSNGNYSVMTTDQGTGYSRSKDLAVTRWREDPIINQYGMFFYIKNKENHDTWSSTYAPYNIQPDHYEVVFTAGKSYYKRTDGKVETTTEVIVASGDNAEIRRVKLKNNDKESIIMEITSYYELVMAPHNSDLAHPAFSNLFVETQFDEKYKALIAKRRPRGPQDQGMWMAQIPVMEDDSMGDIQYETDRMQFIGRGHTVNSPIMMERDKPMSNTVGNVLDPIFSLRLRVQIKPGQSTRISFVTMIAHSKESLYELLDKYSSIETCDASFWLAVSRSQVETKYLNIKAADMEQYQNMISDIVFISPLRRKYSKLISMNRKGQSALWAYGISGDRPIILVMLKESSNMGILYDVLKAHEYWRLKDLRTDLVILIQEENNYVSPLMGMVKDIVYSSYTNEGLSRQGDIFILNVNNLASEDVYVLCGAARLIFQGNQETLEEQMTVSIEHPSHILKEITNKVDYEETLFEEQSLQFFNGLGGFKESGEAYIIQLAKDQFTPVPWSNIIANPKFGFVVTESGGGFTWYGNSRENKLTPWSNDPVSDMPGEIFYLRDESDSIWSLTPLPVKEADCTITHGFGYTQFEQVSHGISQKLLQFVPEEESTKISIITLKNTSNGKRNLSLTYYITPVLGVQSSDMAMHLISSQGEDGILMVENPYNREFAEQVLFMNTSICNKSVTGNRITFFGDGGIKAPDALHLRQLPGELGAGYDPCAAMTTEINLQPGETIELVFVLGVAPDKEKAFNYGKQFLTVEKAKSALEAVKTFWKDTLQVIQVKTPDPAMNLMLNGWLMYQVISCRLWARSGFYQSGGAFGFRDQLQDSLGTMMLCPQLAKEQILKHARHQFVEGDVLHWWHEPKIKGTRTRISDDYLWLPYVVAEYVKTTKDGSILDTSLPFLEENILKGYEEERYCTPVQSEETASLYEHCIRAIKNGLTFGERGLPLMGTGDWNDGMNRVGYKGKGESVWLGWFLYTTLQKFIPLCQAKNDTENVDTFKQIASQLLVHIEENGWDGNWYRRAFFDDGTPLGSAQNTECIIDSLAQTWAVISETGNLERKEKAMNALEDYLVSREEGVIKLLTPPFGEGTMEPGYIKGYAPGVRENGGQYTHAAAWVIQAFAKLGDGDKAAELFELINPINHGRTHTEVGIYKVEPYVMAADVYSTYPHIGRGGWTWYTGSASWVYKTGIESILGLTKVGDDLHINPCIPKKWASYSLTYRYKETQYEINIENPSMSSKGNVKIILDGQEIHGHVIPLVNDKKTHQVEVVIEK